MSAFVHTLLALQIALTIALAASGVMGGPCRSWRVSASTKAFRAVTRSAGGSMADLVVSARRYKQFAAVLIGDSSQDGLNSEAKKWRRVWNVVAVVV